MPEPTALSRLAEAVGGRVVGDGAHRVDDVIHDSRQARPGTLFVAVTGLASDGHAFVPEAAAAGAAVCVERELDLTRPQLVVEEARSAMGLLAAEVHDHPSRKLRVVGVTGTNGKTMVTRMLGEMWDKPGVVGTLGAVINGRPVPLQRTTPEATDLQRLLARMVEEGVEEVALEASSHGLALNRVTGVEFAVAAFTNLSRDHLDFHGDMESYFAAKVSLFEPSRSKEAVVFIEDSWGARLAEAVEVPVTSVGTGGDVYAQDIEAALTAKAFETSFTLVADSEQIPVRMALGGGFNIENALVAAACALRTGLGLPKIAKGLATAGALPGRFERVDTGLGLDIIVDYAHTPHAIATVVAASRPLASGRIIVVVGAGGDRDPEKRPLMGEAAATADTVIVTNDNPRGENPEAIIEAVAGGARAAGGDVIEEPDRRAAIRTAVARAATDDVILILGKGHEQGQEFADRIEPFDDRAVALEEAMAK